MENYKVTYGKYLWSYHPLISIKRDRLYIYVNNWTCWNIYDIITNTSYDGIVPVRELYMKSVKVNETIKDMLLSKDEDNRRLAEIMIENKFAEKYKHEVI